MNSTIINYTIINSTDINSTVVNFTVVNSINNIFYVLLGIISILVCILFWITIISILRSLCRRVYRHMNSRVYRHMNSRVNQYTNVSNIHAYEIQLIEIESPPTDTDCSICQSKYLDSETLFTWCSLYPCEHMFHVKCIQPWIHQHNTCPMCRTVIPILSF